ncbi:MAG: SDR family NAD(P)-dependent oxidoreductase [Alphaproteobacteria bacterium]|nr:SDR family NAD(P)-dependent oxidoreductase [Alphaproteobacteria bacterium]
MQPKRILITGGCSGLGRALSLAYMEEGHDVTVADIASADHAPAGANHVFYDCATADTGPITKEPSWDIIICNAGISDSTDFLDTDNALDEKIIRTNVLGHIELVRTLLQKDKISPYGSLVFICSATYCLPFSIAVTYGASKAALDGFAFALSPYVRNRNISISRVYPGPIKTPHAEKYYARFNQNKGADPVKVAGEIVKGIRRKKRRIFPDRTGRVFRLLSFFTPSLLDYLMYKKYHS